MERHSIAEPAAFDLGDLAALGWPQAAVLLSESRERGLGTPGEFELDLGRRVAELEA